MKAQRSSYRPAMMVSIKDIRKLEWERLCILPIQDFNILLHESVVAAGGLHLDFETKGLKLLHACTEQFLADMLEGVMVKGKSKLTKKDRVLIQRIGGIARKKD